MTDEDKLIKYNWTVYITKELLECDLEELSSDPLRDVPSAYLMGKATTYRDTLHNLTNDDIWLKSLEELKQILID